MKQTRLMKTAITIVSLLLLAGVMIRPSQAHVGAPDPVAIKLFRGTIEGLDPSQRLVVVQTEEKDLVWLLRVADGELMEGLNKGDHVIVAVDDRGLATKIVKVSPEPEDAPVFRN